MARRLASQRFSLGVGSATSYTLPQGANLLGVVAVDQYSGMVDVYYEYDDAKEPLTYSPFWFFAAGAGLRVPEHFTLLGIVPNFSGAIYWSLEP